MAKVSNRRQLRRSFTRSLEHLEERRLLAIDLASVASEQQLAAQKTQLAPLPPLPAASVVASIGSPTSTAASASASSAANAPNAVLGGPAVTPGTWTLASNPSPNSDGIQMMMLAPDGSVMAHGGGGGAGDTWYKLTPDATGSYINGTWSQLASMNVGRLYFGSDVLPDNRVFVAGGEYSNINESETNRAEIYDPATNTWTNVPNFPQSEFGDGLTTVLPDGRILAGYLAGPQTYIFDPTTLTWSQTGTKLRGDAQTEETWVKLPDNSILSYDVSASINSGVPRAQRYIPSTGQWVDAGQLPAQLSSAANGYELGPALLLPDGRAFFTGANGNTAYYDPSTNSWSAGPVIPNGLAAGDAPGAMLPNGHVLLATAPPVNGGSFPGPTTIFEFDPATNTFTDVTPSNLNLSGHSFSTTMLVLPSGQVALCNDGTVLDIYTPSGGPDPAWAPTITNIAFNGGDTFTLTGTQLNGISEGASYGDDAQMASNYPIVRLTNYVTGAITYARSFDWSSTGVATDGTPVTTQFQMPPGTLGGTYLVTVIANGIPSNTVGIGMFVLAHTPTQDEVVGTEPTDFEIDFASPFDPATLDASDLTVNGIPADSVTPLDGQRVVFHFNTSPVTSKGLQSMAMAAGSVLQQGTGTPLQAFNSEFRYDPTPLTVTSIEPASGSTVELPLTNLVVHFSEAYDVASLDVGDLAISQGQVTGVTPIDATTASFTLAGITNEGPLSIHFAAGAFTDPVGDPSLSFDGSLTLDIGTIPYPAPLTAVPPLGGQVYDPGVNGFIGPSGDTDSFTIDVPAGQTISVVTQPDNSLAPQITILAPGGATVATTSAAAGQAVVFNSVATTAAGTYTVVVGGAGGTTGFYNVRIALNAAFEDGEFGGPSDHSIATAQSLDGGFTDLGGGISRTAVLGQSDKPLGTLSNEIEPNNTLATANDATHNFVPETSSLYQIAIKGNLEAAGDNDWISLGTLRAGDLLTVSESGQGSGRGSVPDTYLELYRGSAASPIFVTSNDDGGPSLDSIINQLSITTTDTYYINARSFANGYSGTYDLAAWLQPASIAPGTGSTVTSETEPNNSAATATDASHAWQPVQYVSLTNATAGDADFYKFHFNAGDIVSTVIHSEGNTPHVVTLYDNLGNVLAQEDGESFTSDANSPIFGYLIQNTGDYYVSVQGGADNYQAQMFLSSTTPPPPPIVHDDFFSFALTAGDSVTLALSGVNGGTLGVDLEDGGGNVLATGQPAANVASATAPWVAPTSGVYYARVFSNDTLDYNLVVNRNAAFDLEPNNTAANATDLNGTLGALGYLDSSSPPLDGQFAFTVDPNLSSVSLSANIAGALNLQEQAPGSLTAHYSGQILMDRESDSVSFVGGSAINAIAQPGPFQPGNQSADYAGEILPNVGIVWPALVTNLSLDARSGVLSTSNSIGLGTITQSFDVNSLLASITSGTLAYDITGITSGTTSIAGVSEVNQAATPGSVVETAGHLHLVIPIHVVATLIVPVVNLPATLTLDGQLVGDYTSPGPIDPVDYYSVHLSAGQSVQVSTATPLDSPSSAPTNTLDPSLTLLDSLGNVVASDDNSGPDGKNAALTYTAPSDGTYRIAVNAVSGTGEYVLHVAASNLPPVASAGGPYLVTKGGTLSLDASASHDPNPNDILTYSWDVNGDGIFGDAVGVTPTLTWAQLEALGITAPGSYTVSVEVSDGQDADVATTTLTTEYATVAARHIFYNNSAFDGNDPSANPADDGAIAPDKVALLPGQTATFANYTSYSRGINGIMIDMTHPNTVASSDFEFFVGNLGNVPSDWEPGPAPASVTVRPGAGDGGADRVTITWTDNSIQKQWLLVKVIANDDTGLAQDDLFYFGNAIGDTGNLPTDARVNATDQILARANQTIAAINPAALTNPYDFNRDRNVNATDQIIARRNQTAFDSLQLITTPDFADTEAAIAVLEAHAAAARAKALAAGISGSMAAVAGEASIGASALAQQISTAGFQVVASNITTPSSGNVLANRNATSGTISNSAMSTGQAEDIFDSSHADTENLQGGAKNGTASSSPQLRGILPAGAATPNQIALAALMSQWDSSPGFDRGVANANAASSAGNVAIGLRASLAACNDEAVKQLFGGTNGQCG